MGIPLCLHSSFRPLNYGTIPQAERQKKEASVYLGGASFSVFLPGLGGLRLLFWWVRGSGSFSAKALPPLI